MKLAPVAVLITVSIMPIMAIFAIDDQEKQSQLPIAYSTGFDAGLSDWEFADSGWKLKTTVNKGKVEEQEVIPGKGESQPPHQAAKGPSVEAKVGDEESKKLDSKNPELEEESAEVASAPEVNTVLSQYLKKSNYAPEVRSPQHVAILKDKKVTDFQLDVRVHSTHKDYNHRDACLFFGIQSPTQFYYVHLGKKADPHANQIFIVNNADRTKISLTTTPGTDWDDNWHNVRIDRNAITGDIKVYFDDMKTPVMTAKDKTFQWGTVGLGSFDDTADWDDLVLRGHLVESPRGEK